MIVAMGVWIIATVIVIAAITIGIIPPVVIVTVVIIVVLTIPVAQVSILGPAFCPVMAGIMVTTIARIRFAIAVVRMITTTRVMVA
jgi:hypothetical protein